MPFFRSPPAGLWESKQVSVRVPSGTPAPGDRHHITGTLYRIGHFGYSWTSSVSGSNARYMYFSNNGIDPQYSFYRVYGFPVRCLQE